MIRASAIALCLLLGGCATSSAILLPGENGAPTGALAVLDERGDDTAVLDQANSRATLGQRTNVTRLDGNAVPEKFREIVDFLPEAPRAFTLYFEEGSALPKPESNAVLQVMFAEVARRGPGVDVQITGYTDTVDDAPTNDRLSLARARQVLAQLVTRGLNPATSRPVGRGERELAIPTPDGVSEPRNRRVVVVVR